MTGTTVTADQYAVVMQRFSHGLQQLGNRVATSDIVSSLIAWSVFRMKDEETKMVFTTTAQLQLIFSTVIITTPAFSSSMGICNSFVISSAYSPDTNIITIALPAHAPPTLSPTREPNRSNSPVSKPTDRKPFNPCPGQLLIEPYVYQSTFGLGFLKRNIDIDMKTLITAFALNFGLLQTSELALKITTVEKFGQRSVTVKTFVDANYPSMGLVKCYYSLHSANNPLNRVCLASTQSAREVNDLMYPVLVSTLIDEVDLTERGCECPDDAKNFRCNAGENFMLTMLYNKAHYYNTTEEMVTLGWKLQQIIDSGEAGRQKVRSMVSRIAYTSQVNFFDDMNSRSVDYEKDFEFLGNNCGMLSLEVNFAGVFSSLNAHGVSLANLATSGASPPNFSCSDSIFRPQALALMKAQPPVMVVQPYFSCHSTLTTALITAVGVAAGNSALISAIVLTVLLHIIVQIINNTGNPLNRVLPPLRKAAMLEKKSAMEREELREGLRELRESVANDELRREVEELRAVVEALLTSSALESKHQLCMNLRRRQPPRQQSASHPCHQHVKPHLSSRLSYTASTFYDNPMRGIEEPSTQQPSTSRA